MIDISLSLSIYIYIYIDHVYTYIYIYIRIYVCFNMCRVHALTLAPLLAPNKHCKCRSSIPTRRFLPLLGLRGSIVPCIGDHRSPQAI